MGEISLQSSDTVKSLTDIHLGGEVEPCNVDRSLRVALGALNIHLKQKRWSEGGGVTLHRSPVTDRRYGRLLVPALPV